MKTIIAATLLVLSATWTTATAQVLKLPMVGTCMTTDDMGALLEDRYQEVLFAGGPGAVEMPNGETAEGVIVLSATPDWSTYTITISFAKEGTTCMIGSGSNLQPIARDGTLL